MTSGEPATTSRCAECAMPLAPDQSYCIVCGARRGPLPARIAVALTDIEDHGRPIAPDDPDLTEPQPEAEPESLVSAARAGVVGLLIMLAFGVVIGGAFSSGGLGALANTIVVAVRPSVQQAAQVVTTVSGGGGGGGGRSAGRQRRRGWRWRWGWQWRGCGNDRSDDPGPAPGDRHRQPDADDEPRHRDHPAGDASVDQSRVDDRPRPAGVPAGLGDERRAPVSRNAAQAGGACRQL